MQPFTTFESTAAPLDLANVDTDQIIPARFMRRPRDDRYASYAFHDLRFWPDGQPRADFILNQPPFDQAGILVAGRNFGVGSSREAAVYALQALGFRAVIADGFGDIFFSNALKNGLLPVALPEAAVTSLRQTAVRQANVTICISLERQIVLDSTGQTHHFAIPGFARDCLLRGLDEIGLTLTLAPAIAAFESDRRSPL